MHPIRNHRLIAVGTWIQRKKSPLVALLDKKQFEPVDTAPSGASYNDAMSAQMKFNDDMRSGAPPAVVFAQQAMRLVSGRRREQQRQGARWSVKPVADACDRFLDHVAFFCLGQRQWGLTVETPLTKALPALATPFQEMTTAIAEMRETERHVSRDLAAATATRAYEAANAIRDLLMTEYRRVPSPVKLPLIDIRISEPQRARALRTAVEHCDELVVAWYRFTFASEPPPLRREQLEHLGTALDAASEIAAFQAKRDQCQQLSYSGKADRAEARQALSELKDGIAGFEEALYRANASA